MFVTFYQNNIIIVCVIAAERGELGCRKKRFCVVYSSY